MTSSRSTAASAPICWPLAGTPEFERTDPSWRSSLADRLARDLRRHVIEPWFPRSVDRRHGGFHAEFDRRWRPRPAPRRILEFEARQTRSAARLGIAYPSQAQWIDIARHGLLFLREVMHDPQAGGYFWSVSRTGTPLHDGTKHAHSTAYLISSAAAVYRLTGDDAALALAQDAFEWLDGALHDAQYGGYFGWATRDGRVIHTPEEAPPGLAEPTGGQPGTKDANVHSDLLEALAELYLAGPDQRVLARLAEVAVAMTEQLATPDGAIHFAADAAWRPVPSLERYGYHLQTPLRLLNAAPLLGRSADWALEFCRRVVDHAIVRAWGRPPGGFAEAGPGAGSDSLGGARLVLAPRAWWVQAEGVRTLLLLGLQPAADGRYRRLADELLAFIERRLLDHRFGGWYESAGNEIGWPRRLFRGRAKSGLWKDASHETDLYLTGLRMLRGLPRDAPLE